ncbi:hypothetical protein G4B88_011842 [Cannabis sativa]|uniref:Uncharacterized protein n=1 Tax=Cannabis sativa TaxID=3483 RepID=A0A7J6HBZ3_CANSA|nr:hypothetical protein G4B88_011842 [Cannabis sativa]
MDSCKVLCAGAKSSTGLVHEKLLQLIPKPASYSISTSTISLPVEMSVPRCDDTRIEEGKVGSGVGGVRRVRWKGVGAGQPPLDKVTSNSTEAIRRKLTTSSLLTTSNISSTVPFLRGEHNVAILWMKTHELYVLHRCFPFLFPTAVTTTLTHSQEGIGCGSGANVFGEVKMLTSAAEADIRFEGKENEAFRRNLKPIKFPVGENDLVSICATNTL